MICVVRAFNYLVALLAVALPRVVLAVLVAVRAVGYPAPVRACAAGAGELALVHHPGVPLVALRAVALAGEVDATEAGFLFEKVGK